MIKESANYTNRFCFLMLLHIRVIARNLHPQFLTRAEDVGEGPEQSQARIPFKTLT